MTEMFSIHGGNSLDYDGYLVLTRGIGHNPDDRNGENFRRFPHIKIVRLNNGYGSAGTLPLPRYYEDFAQRCANFVEMSSGCTRWIIGNEPNLSVERPEGQPIDPVMYAYCYTLCRDKIKALPGHADDQVLIAAVGPWNVDTKYSGNPSGDWIQYVQDIQREMLAGGLDGFALHTYAREQSPASVHDTARMSPPFEHYHNGFQTFTDWMAAMLPRFRGLPCYISEMCLAGKPWADVDTGFVAEAYREIDIWNRSHGDQPIRCMALYRWEYDQWKIRDKERVHEDFYNAVAQGYTWPVTEPPEPPEPPEENDMLQNPSLELPYVQDSVHSTVKIAHDWAYFASDGKPPERDGPCQLPEYKPAPITQDARRVYEGNTSQCWFIRWKIFDAGIYQVVDVEEGASYQLDVMAQAWCSDSDDPTVSDGDMHVMLGIDPTGGTDAFASTVVWSGWDRAGAEYKQMHSYRVQATGSKLTVFVRAWNKWELSHNDIYIDDAYLVQVSAPPIEPPDGCEPVDYERIRAIVRDELDKRAPAVYPR